MHASKCGEMCVLYLTSQCLIFDMLKGRKARMTEPALPATQKMDAPDDQSEMSMMHHSAPAVTSELDPAYSIDYVETEQTVSSDINQDGT